MEAEMGRKGRFPKSDRPKQMARLRAEREVDEADQGGPLAEMVRDAEADSQDNLARMRAEKAEREAKEYGERKAREDAQLVEMLMRPTVVRPPARPWDEETTSPTGGPTPEVGGDPGALAVAAPTGRPEPVAPTKEPPGGESPDGDLALDLEVILAQDWREIIVRRIAAYGYSYNELGRETGLSPSAIMYLAKGQRSVNLHTAQKLCAALDLVLVPREMINAPNEDGA
jgi:hypothetical protein